MKLRFPVLLVHFLLSTGFVPWYFFAEATVITCPIQLQTFTDADCTKPALNAHHNVIHVSDTGDCQFILDGLFKAVCENNSLQLQPCLTSKFIAPKSYQLNTCTAVIPSDSFQHRHEEDSNVGAYISFIGSCNNGNDEIECPKYKPIESGTPISSPAERYVIKDTVSLPSAPLPPNAFADQPLNITLAHEIVYLAGKLIYQMSDEHNSELLPDGYTFHLWKDTGSTEVLVISTEHEDNEPGKIMVLFRGTDDTRDGDWLTNINLPKVPYGPKNAVLDGSITSIDYFGSSTVQKIRVHRGFNGVFSDGLYQIVLDAIMPLLKRESNRKLYYENTIYFGGHSLGGANAQVFGTYFAHFHPNVKTHVITLGSPRQGNYAYKILAESLQNLSIWRMVNCRDVVPRVPYFRYYHAGHLLWKKCNPPGDEKLRNDIVEAYYRQIGDTDQKLAHTPSNFVVKSIEPTMITDHFGGAYLEWLEYGMHHGKNWTVVFEPLLNGTMS